MAETSPAASSGAPRRPWILAAMLLFGIAALWRLASPTSTDVAWLLTVGEHILDGAVPYRDIIEVNPPGSVLLYMPAAWLGRCSGLAAECWVVLLGLAASAASLALCSLILARSALMPRRTAGPLLCAAVAVLTILPAGAFAQREHVILGGLLPLLVCVAVRAAQAKPDRLAALAAGVIGGLVLAIKPHYGLGLVTASPCLAARPGRRLGAPPFELLVAGAVAALCGLAELAAFPVFTTSILPLLTRIYLPARLAPMALVTLPWTVVELAALVLYGAIRAGRPAPMLADVTAAASAGFFGAFLVQGKGWAYHLYPATAATLLALVIVLATAADRGSSASARPLLGKAAGFSRAAATAVLFTAATFGFDARLAMDAQAPGLAEAVARLAPHPRLLSLAGDIAVGHPLTRQIGGRWVGRLMSSWISLNVRRLAPEPAARAAFVRDLAFEEAILAGDIRREQPDGILASARVLPALLSEEPAVGKALQAYRLAGRFGAVLLFTRRP